MFQSLACSTCLYLCATRVSYIAPPVFYTLLYSISVVYVSFLLEFIWLAAFHFQHHIGDLFLFSESPKVLIKFIEQQEHHHVFPRIIWRPHHKKHVMDWQTINHQGINNSIVHWMICLWTGLCLKCHKINELIVSFHYLKSCTGDSVPWKKTTGARLLNRKTGYKKAVRWQQ